MILKETTTAIETLVGNIENLIGMIGTTHKGVTFTITGHGEENGNYKLFSDTKITKHNSIGINRFFSDVIAGDAKLETK